MPASKEGFKTKWEGSAQARTDFAKDIGLDNANGLKTEVTYGTPSASDTSKPATPPGSGGDGNATANQQIVSTIVQNVKAGNEPLTDQASHIEGQPNQLSIYVQATRDKGYTDDEITNTLTSSAMTDDGKVDVEEARKVLGDLPQKTTT